MPTETIAILAFVVLMFVVFMAGLAYAERNTREFRD